MLGMAWIPKSVTCRDDVEPVLLSQNGSGRSQIEPTAAHSRVSPMHPARSRLGRAGQAGQGCPAWISIHRASEDCVSMKLRMSSSAATVMVSETSAAGRLSAVIVDPETWMNNV